MCCKTLSGLRQGAALFGFAVLSLWLTAPLAGANAAPEPLSAAAEQINAKQPAAKQAAAAGRKTPGSGKAEEAPRWALAIHGGAGTITRKRMTPAQEADYRAALAGALAAGRAVLEGGGAAGDAVEAVITRLEDDPKFNAGRGAVFTWQGTNEMDASFMEGDGRKAGAVAGVRHVKNPITLARAVLRDGRHVMLSGDGAEEFAAEQGIVLVDPAYFATPRRREQLEAFKAKTTAANGAASSLKPYKYGTVGAVALDQHGHIAAGTSTGGTTGKRWGRIGDSPIIGAGTYADDRACAVSATGTGEYFIRVSAAKSICDAMHPGGLDAQAAADQVIADIGALGGDGGVIVVSPSGEAVFSFNTDGMYRARATSDGVEDVAIFAGETQPAKTAAPAR